MKLATLLLALATLTACGLGDPEVRCTPNDPASGIESECYVVPSEQR